MEEIVSIRQNKHKKNYEANIKWEGYEAKYNTWESLNGLYENLDFEGKDVYTFLRKIKLIYPIMKTLIAPPHHCTTAPPHHRPTAPPHHRITVPPHHCITTPPYHRTTEDT